MKKILAAFAAATAIVSSSAVLADDAKHFNGGFIGAEAGYLNAEDGLDGLSYAAFAGFRRQTDSGFVYGIDGTFGSVDIDYMDEIWTVNASVGKAFGQDQRNLVFGGVGYVKATASAFGYSVSGDDVTFHLGYERALGEQVSVRVKAQSYSDTTIVGTIGFGIRF